MKLLDLSTVATAELKTAEKAHAATVGVDGPREKELAAEVRTWKRIVTLCDAGELVLPDDVSAVDGSGGAAAALKPAEVWLPLVATVQAKLERRVEQCAALPASVGEDGPGNRRSPVGQDGPSSKREPLEKRIAALRALRDLLRRSAIFAGAKLPPFDLPSGRKAA